MWLTKATRVLLYNSRCFPRTCRGIPLKLTRPLLLTAEFQIRCLEVVLERFTNKKFKAVLHFQTLITFEANTACSCNWYIQFIIFHRFSQCVHNTIFLILILLCVNFKLNFTYYLLTLFISHLFTSFGVEVVAHAPRVPALFRFSKLYLKN